MEYSYEKNLAFFFMCMSMYMIRNILTKLNPIYLQMKKQKIRWTQ